LKQVDFTFFKWLGWLSAFAVSSWFLMNYEALMNAGLGLNRAGSVMVYSHLTNLANEVPLGYFALFLVALSIVMWIKETFHLTKDTQSLANSETECWEVNV
jgi:hypothetical protein